MILRINLWFPGWFRDSSHLLPCYLYLIDFTTTQNDFNFENFPKNIISALISVWSEQRYSNFQIGNTCVNKKIVKNIFCPTNMSMFQLFC